LKDEEPLSTYKVQNNHTLHLVKGAAKPGSTPAPSASNATSSPSSTNASAAAAAQARGVPTNLNAGLPYAGNPLAQLEGAMGHGYGGGTFNPFAQMPGMDGQNLNDPNAVSGIVIGYHDETRQEANAIIARSERWPTCSTTPRRSARL
jgi:ubiquilin